MSCHSKHIGDVLTTIIYVWNNISIINLLNKLSTELTNCLSLINHLRHYSARSPGPRQPLRLPLFSLLLVAY